jgi:redox-sensitive bicupin YhaK (pirin superfamily)
MPNLKSIEAIIPAPATHWVGDGFLMHNFIPQSINQNRVSPFLMLDHGAKKYFEPTATPRGVGVHPHRGFETVTIAYKGRVAHHDSAGNSGIIGEGEVQWMTAGSGILHKEYHEKEFSQKGGEFHMVQIWVNLPKIDKMTEPKYQGITKDMIVKQNLDQKGSYIELIAGQYNGQTGPASTFSPINLWNVYLNQDCKANFTLPQNYNTMLLVIDGELGINGKNVSKDQIVLFENDGEEINLTANQDSICLILSGEPIAEPIFHYGPFAMNTREEILQAFEDLENGKFGYLED